jgi:hypothetical protein
MALDVTVTTYIIHPSQHTNRREKMQAIELYVSQQKATGLFVVMSDGEQVSGGFKSEDDAFAARWEMLTDDQREALTIDAELDAEFAEEAAAERRLSYGCGIQ